MIAAGSRAARSVGLSAILAVAATLAACGGGDSPPQTDERDAAAAVRELQRTFAARDLERVCERMTESARRQAGLVAHGKPGACPQDLREALAVIRSGGGWLGRRDAKAAAVKVEGDRATVTVTDAGMQTDVPLRKESDRWRLDSFFGTPPAVTDAVASEISTAAFPAAPPGAEVRAGDDTGSCFPFFDDAFPEIGGGCLLKARGAKVAITISTAFGAFKFADCEFHYSVSLDATGRTWTTGAEFIGAVNNGCADADPCRDASGALLPWRGRISRRRDGSFSHRMDACLTTCIGDYAGSLVTTLERHGNDWRIDVPNAGVGNSGFRIDGPMAVTTEGFRLSAAD